MTFSRQRLHYAERQWNKEMAFFRQYKPLEEHTLYLLLNDPDPLKRKAAAMHLQLRGLGLSVAQKMCHSTNYKARDLSCFILGQIVTPESILPAIMAQLDALAASDPTATVRGSAISAMGHRWGKKADFWPMLANRCRLAATDTSVTVRVSVAGALCHNTHPDETLLPVLIQLLRDKQGEVRSWAGCAVNGQGYDTPELHAIFAAMLNDEHAGARDEAKIWQEEHSVKEE
ncbi:hypothetical protein CHU32_09140 [Superficieibacter electus]|uniref:HEAT repeat domain-containing protein n=1 Tax=Superficieibacter electus TaxID=2022662 RepID=A0A2P5GRR9_9ENTR|nr:hypothetical protein [Superficieibacter electus]POP45953.1 hypothetical protein CHU33_07595 [Superficieibacter electus]POP49260.1 hypothetical protein CHU32_09140 [Superficieibacter electus]